MIFVDSHCDTISKILEHNGDIHLNDFHVDLKRMSAYEGFVQFFACFIPPSIGNAYSLRHALKLLDRFYMELDKHNDIMSLCCTYNDVHSCLDSGKTAAILSLEDGVALQGEISNLRMFYRLGIRSICLTWNYRNEIADGVNDSCSSGGLSSFGIKTVNEMNRLGMIVDASHMSEHGFWDVLQITNSPIIASHSNSKTICNHPRNLTDAQISAIARNGGVIGINLCPAFLGGSGPGIDEIVAHIRHIVSIAGEDSIGLGCDFDGIESTPAGIEGVQHVYKITERLLQLNFSEEAVRKFAGQNFIRIIQKVLK